MGLNVKKIASEIMKWDNSKKTIDSAREFTAINNLLGQVLSGQFDKNTIKQDADYLMGLMIEYANTYIPQDYMDNLPDIITSQESENNSDQNELPTTTAPSLTPNEFVNSYETNVKPVVEDLIAEADSYYIDESALKGKKQEYETAINNNKPAKEVAQLYSQLVVEYNKLLEKVEKKRKEKAGQICQDIYCAANGLDWGGLFGHSDKENKIINAVNEITEYNVIEVLNAWEESAYNDSTGDSCLLETIYGEFQFNTSGRKTKLTNHILDCLEKAAKKIERYNDILPYVTRIKAEMSCTCWSYGKIYNNFNQIIAILKEDEPEIAPAESAEQETPAA